MIKGYAFLFLAHVILVSSVPDVDCSNPALVCTEDGRWVKNILDNYHQIPTEDACCSLCNDKNKCDKWSYYSRAKHCKTFSDAAVPFPRSKWRRYSTIDGCPKADICPYLDGIAGHGTSCSNPTGSSVVGATCDPESDCGTSYTCAAGVAYPGGDLICAGCGWACDGADESTCICPDCDSDDDCTAVTSEDQRIATCIGSPKECECTIGNTGKSCGYPSAEFPNCDDCGSVSASSIVNILSENERKQVRIDELQIGDRVLSADDAGQLFYDEIFFEYHGFPSTGSVYNYELIRIAHDDGFIDISPKHLIYASTKNVTSTVDHCIIYNFEQICAYPADIVYVGDIIWVVDFDKEFKLTSSYVTAITKVVDKIRSPRSMNGNIIVNNVLASCYTHHHNTNAAVYSVLRMMYQVYPQIMNYQLLADIWINSELVRLPETLAVEYELFAEYGTLVVYAVQLLLVSVFFHGVRKLSVSIKR